MNTPQNTDNINTKGNILGVYVHALTYSNALTIIDKIINTKNFGYICVSAVHLIMECQKSILLKTGVNNATIVTPDGMPLVWILRKQGKKTEKVHGPVLMEKICELAAQKQYRIYLLGGRIGQAEQVANHLNHRFPLLQIVGTKDTPTRPLSENENLKVIATINRAKAHIVFIGMGCPHQEFWMIKNRKKLNANILIGVGSAFDLITGYTIQAPNWIQNSGLQWLFRFFQEPRRLWYRYTMTNIYFVLLILKKYLLTALLNQK